MPTITATAPELWTTLIEICNQLGIATSTLPALTTPQEIMEFMHTLNIDLQPLYSEVTTLEQTGWTWVYNAPVNPSETTDMVVRGVTDLTVVGGAATGISQGKKIFGTISKVATVLALVAAFGVSIFERPEVEVDVDELAEGLKPWTVDGDDAVPVLIDADGTTYLDERAIQKFREDLANLGIFDVTPELPIESDGWYKINGGKISYNNMINDNWDESFVIPSLPISLTTTEHSYVVEHIFIRSFNETEYTDITSRCLIYAISTSESADPYCTIQIAADISDLVDVTPPSSFRYNYKITGLRDGEPVQNISTGSGTITYDTYESSDGRTANGYIFTDFTLNNKYSTILSTSVPSFPYSGNPFSRSKLTIAFGSPGGGVPGFEPNNPTVGDLTKSLTDIFPDWTSNGVTIPSPKDDDLTNTADWLPVSINDTELKDHTATSEDQNGDTSEDAQQSIMEKLMELIQTLAQEQAGTGDEVITPTIPVEDSGDTPPATPPLVSGASNGLWTIYNPTLSEVQQFGAWLWSESIIDQIKRQFANPIDGVIGFLSIYCTPITGGRKIIKAGYLESPVSAKEVTNQYVTIDCGSVTVPEYYRTAIDYTRSKVDIYLPFIGIVPLDCSVVTGSTLQVIYRIDVLTGTCLAQIKVIKQNSDAVMYTYNGNCGVQLPLTSGTYTGLVGTIMGLGQGIISAGMGDFSGAVSGAMQMVSSMGTHVQKSGSLASNAGALGIRIPYIIITHPTAYDAMIYNQFYGYPSNVYQRLSAMSGFVRVKDVHLDDITCTDQELDMIYSRLKEGVII